MSEAQPASILVLVRDLLFSSKILSEARAAGVAAKVVRDPDKLDSVSDMEPRLLIADLALPGAIPAAANWGRAAPGRSVVAFVAHVDQSTIAQARQAGLDNVLTRGRFVQLLPQIIRDLPR
jgi:DNA-binding NarL/FixJ family response regulator